MNSKKKKTRHTFVVCAYGESPYLEACICSLLAQKGRSEILIATSTLNDLIKETAEKYGLAVRMNHGETGLAGDWNFALSCAETPYVTLAHQDDRYYENYSRDVVRALDSCRRPLIAFTDYNELREGRTVTDNRLLKVKRLMLTPLKVRAFWKSVFVRRRILSMGSAICCPSVTFAKENLEGFAFRNNMKSNIDWQAWEELSRRKGEFAYVPVPSMEHRIHPASTTSTLLEQNARREEDLAVFRRFWPAWMAWLIEHFYQSGEKSNQLGR